MESNGIDLRESIFFTARKGMLPCTSKESAGPASSSGGASSSSGYYSARIHTLMERTSKSDMSKEDAEIEASRDHWTEVEPGYCTAVTSASMDSSTSESQSLGCVEVLSETERLKLYEENVEVIRSLQRENPESCFFQIGDGGVVVGRKIAEGGQAEIYDAGMIRYGEDGDEYAVVFKVFKAGYSLLDLQKQWPLALLHKLAPLNEVEDDDGTWVCNRIMYGRLLGDGRFAFEMVRFWGDLRKLLDVRMQHNGNQRPPFMMSDGNYHECCMLELMGKIAVGMRELHGEGTLHRDLKASNVLVESAKFLVSRNEEDRLDPLQLNHSFGCLVSDFECSIGLVGTGYWRAPEILEALKNRTVHTTPSLFTPESDVYSYAMTCYEILTGCKPFEDIEDIGSVSIDDVLQGRRPNLPSHLRPWVEELLTKCWHKDPLERPTFQEIVDILKGIVCDDLGCQSESVFFKEH